MPPKTCFYGPPGVGKTTVGAGAPRAIFVPTEAGAENLDVTRFPVAETLADFMHHLHLVATGDHEHGAVVIDTLNGLLDLYYRDKKGILGEKGKPLYDFVGYGGFNGWSAVARDLAGDIFGPLNQCQRRGMYVILLAHTGEYTRKNPLGEDVSVSAPSVPKWVWKEIHPWLDVIGRAEYVYSVKTRITGPGKTVVKASTDADTDGKGRKVQVRRLIFTGGVEQDCKTRIGYELPAEMPLSWEAFASSLGNLRALAGEIRDRWHFIDDDKRPGMLAWLGVADLDSLHQADRSKLSQLRNRLLEKQAEAAAAEISTDKTQSIEGEQ